MKKVLIFVLTIFIFSVTLIYAETFEREYRLVGDRFNIKVLLSGEGGKGNVYQDGVYVGRYKRTCMTLHFTVREKMFMGKFDNNNGIVGVYSKRNSLGVKKFMMFWLDDSVILGGAK